MNTTCVMMTNSDGSVDLYSAAIIGREIVIQEHVVREEAYDMHISSRLIRKYAVEPGIYNIMFPNDRERDVIIHCEDHLIIDDLTVIFSESERYALSIH